MREMGFSEYLSPKLQGTIITAFHYPNHPRFQFDAFYTRLNDKGFVIYPGKVSSSDCFRIGNIGHLFESDIRAVLRAIQATVDEMEITLSVD
jgi:2-aminoethylphosphonate-pyruvate transaminase